MQIRLDDLSSPAVHALLGEHLRSVALLSPPESVHALGIEALKAPDIAFWTAWRNDELLGCGALKRLTAQHAELKSMRTATPHLRRGVARAMVGHLLDEAKRRGFTQVSLETGSSTAFAPARALYESVGFAYCGPFADYVVDPHSVFMSRAI